MADGVIEEVLRIRNETGPGLKDTARDARMAEEEIARLKAALAQAQAGLGGLGRQMVPLASTTKDMSRHMGQLAFQLNDVATMAAMGANPLMILASQGGQLVQVFTAAGGVVPLLTAALAKVGAAASALAAPIAIVAGSAAVLYGAWRILTFEADQASEALARLTPQVEALKKAVTSANDAQGKADDIIALATGQADQYSAALDRQVEAYQEGRRATDQLLAAKVEELEKAQTLTAQWTENDKALKEARETLAGYRAETESTVETLADIANAERHAAENAETLAEAKKREAEARRLAAAAAREEAKAFRALQVELTRELEVARIVRDDMIAMADRMFTPEVDEAAVALRALDTALANTHLTASDLALAEAGLVLAFSRGAISADQYAAALGRLNAAKGGGDFGAVTAVNAVAGGPQAAMGSIANTGPWGELIAGIISLVANLDKTLMSFDTWHKEVSAMIGKLPEILGNMIEQLIAEGSDVAMSMISDFTTSLAENIDEIIVGLIRGLVSALASFIDLAVVELPTAAVGLVDAMVDLDTWVEAGKKLLEGFTTGQFSDNGKVTGKSAGMGALDILTGGLSGNIADFANTGKFATGTDYVTRSGLAVVHQGERIIPDTGAMSGRTAAVAKGGETHNHFHFPQGLMIGSVAEVARALSREMGTQGRRFQLPAGSVAS